MAQTKVTTESLRNYARGLDVRTKDRTKYSDAWIDGKINAAYEMLSTYRQSFLTEEVLDLRQHILDGVEKIEIDLDLDVVGMKRVFATIDSVSDEPTYNVISWKITPDHTIHLTIQPEKLDPTKENLFTVQYYYFPTVTQDEVFMSMDIYHMLRHAIQSVVWDSLRDFEKANLALEAFRESVRTVINGLDIDVGPKEQWNGGFML